MLQKAMTTSECIIKYDDVLSQNCFFYWKLLLVRTQPSIQNTLLREYECGCS